MAAPVPAKSGSDGKPPGCLILFFLAFLAAGIAVGIVIFYKVHEGVRIHREYVQGTCVITAARLHTNSDSDGTTYRPEFEFEVIVPHDPRNRGDEGRYAAKGYDGADVATSSHDSNNAIVKAFKVNGTYPCWYDPGDPHKAVLAKPSAWNLLWLLFPLPFAGVGFFGTIWVIRSRFRAGAAPSPEREAFLNKGTKRQAAEQAVALLSQAKATPGTRLPYKLAQDQTERLAALGLGCFGLVWTGITGAVWIGMWSGKDWMGIVFLGLFVLVGLGMLAAAAWQAMIGWGVGETAVEVSSYQPLPGEEFEISVAQHGHMAMNELSVWLVCEEKATYRQGTNTRTDSERLLEEKLGAKHNLTVTGAGSEELRIRARVPAEAMHTFKSPHNEVRWFVEVRGDIQRWPDFKRSYPIRVLAAPETEGHA
ncbi:MAG: DUF3592 domain-containing protein [Planctomycetota bacterium]|nr:DUF3592 domain-containing protein [Planctomycetota bacterium]